MPDKNRTLSKSRYIRGLQCHKSLWLYTQKRELRDVEDADTTARFNNGHRVGELAQGLFPGGEMVPYDGLSFEEQINKTVLAMKTGKVIYEATFCHGGVLVKADIMRKGRNGWELYEVKASNSKKDVYLHDIAVQYYVISGSGVTVNKACLVHLNRDYVRKDKLEINELFKIVNVTTGIKAEQTKVKKEVARQKRMLAGMEPIIDIGPYCNDPYPCDFQGHCWKNRRGFA